ncbi:MAG: hypothetical protein IPO95_03995 [Rhodanobacteraceae bacterium]|nr:hypothetical protein [Rhodanobacteraceae bacterium]
MPQLKSGRHVTFSTSPYLDALAAEKDEAKYFALFALRLYASTPEALRDHVVIGYFAEGEGTPPDAPSYNSGYCVADVLEGRTDWSPDEIEDLRQFMVHDPRFGAWLQAQFDDINVAIRDNQVWDSELLVNDVESNDIDVPLLKRAILRKSAMAPDAMRQLRNGTTITSEADKAVEAPALAEAPEMEPRDAPESEPDPWRELPPLTPELRQVILDLAKQPDIHSLSCPYTDYDLWYALIEEQVERSRETGLPYQEAFCLCAPDTGIDGMQRWDEEMSLRHSFRQRLGAMYTSLGKAFAEAICSLFPHGAGCGRAMAKIRKTPGSWSVRNATTFFPTAISASSNARRAPALPEAGFYTKAMRLTKIAIRFTETVDGAIAAAI